MADRDGGRDRARAKEVMAAGLTGMLVLNRLTHRRCALIDAWKRIHFGQDRDHGTAGAILSDEGRRNIGNACLDREAFHLQLVLQELRGLRLLIANFCPGPEALRDLFCHLRPGLDQFRSSFGGRVAGGRQREAGGCEAKSNEGRDEAHE